jgi:SlyX protein
MNDETLEQMQIKIAFLERAATELSDVVFRLHKEIEAMEAKLRAISERLDRTQSDEVSRPQEEERPPHY